jgi:hypothetical protein
MTPDVDHRTPESLWEAWEAAPGPVQPVDSLLSHRIGFIDLAAGQVHMIAVRRLIPPDKGPCDLLASAVPRRFWELIYMPEGRIQLFAKGAP